MICVLNIYIYVKNCNKVAGRTPGRPREGMRKGKGKRKKGKGKSRRKKGTGRGLRGQRSAQPRELCPAPDRL